MHSLIIRFSPGGKLSARVYTRIWRVNSLSLSLSLSLCESASAIDTIRVSRCKCLLIQQVELTRAAMARCCRSSPCHEHPRTPISWRVTSLLGLVGPRTNVFGRIDCEFMSPGWIRHGSSGSSRRFERRRCCHGAATATLSARYAPYSVDTASPFTRTITCANVHRQRTNATSYAKDKLMSRYANPTSSRVLSHGKTWWFRVLRCVQVLSVDGMFVLREMNVR